MLLATCQYMTHVLSCCQQHSNASIALSACCQQSANTSQIQFLPWSGPGPGHGPGPGPWSQLYFHALLNILNKFTCIFISEDGGTDGRRDGWKGGWTDGRADGRADGQTSHCLAMPQSEPGASGMLAPLTHAGQSWRHSKRCLFRGTFGILISNLDVFG
jgi:hypothetical protein